MKRAQMINCIMDEIEARVGRALNLTENRIFEMRETGQSEGAAAYVSGMIPRMEPATFCADRATLEVTIGFELPDDGVRPKRVQRLEAQERLMSELLWTSQVGKSIPHAKIPTIAEMPVSELSDPAIGTFTGGLIWRCFVDLSREC